MDLYLSSQDSLSLQEMLDCDIKTEIDSVFAGTDLSLSNLPPLDLGDSLDNLDNMSPLDDPFAASPSPGDMGTWFTGSSGSSSFNFDLDAGLMVNPSSVMPVAVVAPQLSTTAATSVLGTSTVNIVCTSQSPLVVSSATGNPFTSSGTTVSFVRALGPQQQTLRIANNGIPLLKTVPVTISHQQHQQRHPKQQQQQHQHQQQQNQSNHIVNSQSQSRVQGQKKKQVSNSDSDFDQKAYPKPAYSYSCLIAMALKNSKTGSLPVSEIYNFMCEHFPYFKTAPNGWKNSVRHNLSLNKCFEKIEKPTGNGSQRKGCLWAMNPAKISKMDEEVQKWSRKDPMAIKKAMVCPENLEMLERGEMKREVSASLSCEESEEEDPLSPPTPASLTQSSSVGESKNVEGKMSPEYIDINKLEELGSPITEFDIEVAEGMYETFEDEKLNLGVNITSDILRLPVSVATSTSSTEFSTNTIQGNYVYTPAVSVVNGNSESEDSKILLSANAPQKMEGL